MLNTNILAWDRPAPAELKLDAVCAELRLAINDAAVASRTVERLQEMSADEGYMPAIRYGECLLSVAYRQLSIH